MWPFQRRSCVAAAVLMVALAPGIPAAPAGPRPQDEIHAFLDRFVGAFNRLDWPVFIEMFEDEASVFYPSPPNAPIRATGRAEFEPAWRQVFQGIRVSRTAPPFMDLRPERLHIQMLDDAAIVTFELHDLPGYLGRRTLVLRRHHGTWKIAHLHASNVPAANER